MWWPASSGVVGGSIAWFSASGLVAGFGFLGLAIAWLTCTTRAWLAVRREDYLTHQRWMIRSFALAFAAVMLRIYMPLSQVVGLDYADVYPVIAWLCWVPNLLEAQPLVRWARGVPTSQRAPAASRRPNFCSPIGAYSAGMDMVSRRTALTAYAVQTADNAGSARSSSCERLTAVTCRCH
jgi:hypothetical protein